jgi:hypothetical protein
LEAGTDKGDSERIETTRDADAMADRAVPGEALLELGDCGTAQEVASVDRLSNARQQTVP